MGETPEMSPPNSDASVLALPFPFFLNFYLFPGDSVLA